MVKLKDKEKRELSGGSKALIVKFKNFVVRNLGAPFILIFDALILTVAFLVVHGEAFVNDLAVLAYCFLVVGVILQAVSYVRYRSIGSDAFE